MTMEQVRETFRPHIKGDTLCISDNVFVELDYFVSLFESADPTYESLTAVDGGNLGYADFFDKCRNEGLLN